MNLREKILATEDIESETITVPSWDVDLLIKGMSAGERVLLMQNAYDSNTEQVNMSKVYPDVVVSCAHDPETGEPSTIWYRCRSTGRGGKRFLVHPERRYVIELAERLSRTVGELLYGSPAHRPLSSAEMTEFIALDNLRAWEREQANRRRN
jgi:hypothetical protein